ncbi:Ribosomal protein S27e [Corchorus olitorius]|uniref:40S ribosomal protein S27 n=1 Tax=Corchorus olitorius TaxID=93759 RepID=A0A1R3IQB9_9ROSI|nr:Ribosomal protein S27e [Corchorus olitorius]
MIQEVHEKAQQRQTLEFLVERALPLQKVLLQSSQTLAPHLLSTATMVLQNDIDLLNPPAELEKKKHKLKRLVQSPNSFFMDVKCQGCFNITTVFSHSQTVVVCGNCQTVLCQPTGGRARLTEGCSFRKKGD